MKTYGILVIGCGHIGMEHLLDIYHRGNIRLEAVVDADPQRAQTAAHRCGAAAWGTDYRPFLESEHVDIVIIATYTDSHLPILQDCLAHHKHVLCEKPIGSSINAGKAFCEAVKHAKEKVLVGHILRHNTSYQKIRELIQNGTIGELRLVRMCQNHHALDWNRYCRLLEDCSPAVDCGVHYFDLVQWITGSPIIEVDGFGVKTQPDAPRENYNIVTFRTKSGCSGYYEVGWGKNIRSGNLKEFIGTKGRITLEMQYNREWDVEEGDCISVYHGDSGIYETLNLQSVYKNMYGQLCALIDMIENDTPGNPSMEDVWSAFCVAQAAEESIETGKKICLPSALTV